MQINTQIGEAVAEIGANHYVVRPTFSALSSIGSPDEIESVISGCLDAYKMLSSGMVPRAWAISSCCIMLSACSDIPQELMGYIDESRFPGRMIWRQKAIDVNDLVIMANHCIKWGVMGQPKIKISKAAQARASQSAFDPHEFVAIAMLPHDAGGLGQSRTESWSMTMVEFQRACEARRRFVRGNKPEPLTQEEAQAEFDRFNAKMAKHKARQSA